ncbi:polysaccharide deacetylase family protein [Micrococcus lylae]|uniref:polysaccharide deacetylase family protein n=1 Tax=Micrococcus lylae TaxID=1273 RepID=UPI0021A6961E|nr:polysaccharide deacetylase family protein [Micrococcus lylae]MCT2007163.1 polysaccharide deacetylase family protein [Micrococcus lylae]MCT2072055.1 polysaccharide deacetylase family protein [Micrococcus lylae]
MIRFDDGLSGLTHAAEYMARYGMVGYLAAITRRTARSEIMSLANRYGWEIGNHTSEHRTVKDAGFLASVDAGSRDIMDLVGEYPTTFTYPTGARTAEMDREMALRFNQIQLVSEPHTSAVNLAEPSCFSGWTVVNGLAAPEIQARAMERMKRYVTGSTSQHLVPTIAFHEVAKPGRAPTSAGMVSWDLFTSWIDWLASQGFETILPRMLRPAQVVVDPGFNAYPVATFATGAYPWASSSLSVWSRSTSHQYSGLGCLRASSSTPVTGTVSQGLALEPGRTYRVHVLANVQPTAGAIEVELRPRLMDGRYVGDTLALVRVDANTGGFRDHTATFTMPSGTQNGSLFVRAVGLAGSAVVDHVSIMRADLHDPLLLDA